MTFRLANELYLKRDYRGAITEYEKLKEKYPNLSGCIDIQMNNCRSKLGIDQKSCNADLSEVFNNKLTGWVAVITTYKRTDYLEQQLAAIQNQSIPPNEILIIKNENHFVLNESLYEKYNLKVIQSDINSLYTRWIIGYLSNSKYVCVLDDDVIPGRKWIENCIYYSDLHNALVGPSGRIANPGATPAWSSVENRDKSKIEYCDWVCNSYFFKTDWIKYIVQVQRYNNTQKTFDDIQLATTLKAYGNINVVVPPQPKGVDELNGHIFREYGHDEYALWKRAASEHTNLRGDFIQKLQQVGFEWTK